MRAHQDSYCGLFRFDTGTDGQLHLQRAIPGPTAIPCPTSGKPLRVSTIEADAAAICPACTRRGQGGFVSFEGDLRMAYACPACGLLVWLPGA